MFKLRSIAARLILAISLTVAAACGILGTFSIVQQRSLTQLALDQQLKLQYDSVIAAIDYEGRAALRGQRVSSPRCRRWRTPSPKATATRSWRCCRALAALKPQGIPLISFITPPATAFFRAHRPKLFGEDISARRKTVVESNRAGKPIVGVETGTGFARHFRHDTDHARRQEPRCRRHRRRLRQGIRRPRQAALRRRSCRPPFRRQGFRTLRLDPW